MRTAMSSLHVSSFWSGVASLRNVLTFTNREDGLIHSLLGIFHAHISYFFFRLQSDQRDIDLACLHLEEDDGVLEERPEDEEDAADDPGLHGVQPVRLRRVGRRRVEYVHLRKVGRTSNASLSDIFPIYGCSWAFIKTKCISPEGR